MTVQKMVRSRGRRRSVKAQRPWSRTVRSYFTPKPIRTYGSVRPVAGVYGLGQSFRTKLKYVQNIGLQSTSGAVAKNVFSPQNMFDPDVSGTGHQPMFWDQFTALYARYKVHSARIKVTFNVQTETAGAQCFVAGIIGGSGQSIASDPQTNMEDNHGRYTVCNGRNGSSGQKVLYLDYAPMRDLGITVNDDTLTTPINTGAATYFWNVWCADLQSAGTTGMIANVEIIYDVEFTDNINVSGS